MPDMYGFKTYGERQDERRQFEHDVFYDVWKRGGNPDAINYDRVSESYDNGDCHDLAASREMEEQRHKQIVHPEPEVEEEEEEE